VKILVHICCSVDSHYFLQRLKRDYPNAKLIGFFYDPNIHPYSEYYLRLLDVKRSCKMLGVELIEGEYDFQNWLDAVRGFENEPEKGKRCSLCFDRRFEVSAKKAKELECDYFTSTLLTSPKKSIEQLKASGDELAKRYNLKFLTVDYRTKSGTQEQNKLAKEDRLYRQNYCGCLYALKMQRDTQDILAQELFLPINGQIQPNSIEDKIKLYKKRVELEEQKIRYEIVKYRFINWRILYGVLKRKKEVIPSYFLAMSKLKGNFTRGKIEKEILDVYYFSRAEVKFLTLTYLNKAIDREYKSIKELYFNPPTFEEELKLREKVVGSKYDISVIIVIENIPKGKYEIFLESKIYEDIGEKLIILSKS
jgi:predicted adenine nucleotide alpha hydrolase (AANH) superfamily ATPase